MFWRTWPSVVRTETQHAVVLTARRPAAAATVKAVDPSVEAAARVLDFPVRPLLVLVPPDTAGFTALTGPSGDLAAACTLLRRPAHSPTSWHRPVIVLGPMLSTDELAQLSVLTHESAHALLTLDALDAGAEGMRHLPGCARAWPSGCRSAPGGVSVRWLARSNARPLRGRTTAGCRLQPIRGRRGTDGRSPTYWRSIGSRGTTEWPS